MTMSVIFLWACTRADQPPADQPPADQPPTGPLGSTSEPDCEPVLAPVEVVAGTCTGAVADAFVIESRLTLDGAAGDFPVTIGLLVDHTGDGIVDADDGAELVISTATIGQILYTDAVTGEMDVSVSGAFSDHTAIADVDGDGSTEVVTTETDSDGLQRIVALDGAGVRKWQSEPLLVSPRNPNQVISVADLDGDGIVEVINGLGIVDGRNGAVLATLDLPYGMHVQCELVVADLDQDGVAEILADAYVFRPDGSLAWHADLPGGTYDVLAFPMPLQLDADPEAEVLFESVPYDAPEALFFAYEADGTLIAPAWSAGLGDLGPPCGADFDGDGRTEFAVPTWPAGLTLYDDDLSVLWNLPVLVGGGGCSVFDFDADGTPEITMFTPTSLMIVGFDGSVLFETPLLLEGTRMVPMVVDLEGDGHSELIAADGEITVFQQVNGGWPPSTMSWPIHDFAEGRVTDDGQVSNPAYWQGGGLHARTVEPSTAAGYDLRVDSIGGCVTTCDEGPVVVALQVSNTGSADAPGSTLRLSTPDGTTIEEQSVEPLAPGASSQVMFELSDPTLFAVPLEAWVEAGGDTCDESDDRVTLTPPC